MHLCFNYLALLQCYLLKFFYNFFFRVMISNKELVVTLIRPTKSMLR